MGYTLSDLSDRNLRTRLRRRKTPYYAVLTVGRRLGYERGPGLRKAFWVASVRLKNVEGYKRKRIGIADDDQEPDGQRVLNVEQAVVAAGTWFASPKIAEIASETRPVRFSYVLHFCPCGDVYTVGHAVFEFLEWKRKFGAPSTYASCVAMTNRFVLPKLAGIPTSELTADDLRDLMTTIEATPPMVGGRVWDTLDDPSLLSNEARRKRRVTANNTLSFVKSALEMAWEENKIKDNNAWRRVRRFRRIDRARTNFLTWDQVRDLLRVSAPEMRRLILAAVYTGARITELLGLRAQDIMAHRMAIYVQPQKTYRGRHVALPDEAYEFFKEVAIGMRPNDKLLVRDNGQPWVSSKLPAAKIKTAYQKIGLPCSFVFHTLRHTYASQLIQSGTPLVVIARQMGHANIMTVVRFYLHCADDFYDDELRKTFNPRLRGNLNIFPPVEQPAQLLNRQRNQQTSQSRLPKHAQFATN